MKAFITFLLAFAFVGLALVFIPMERMFDQITDTDKIEEVVVENRLYDKVFEQIAERIRKQDAVRQFDSTTLAFSQGEVAAILRKVFPEEWFLNTLRALHGRVVQRLDPVPQRLSFSIELRDRKELFVDELSRMLNERIDQLPECGPKDLARLQSKTLTRRKTLKDLIGKCRPPAPLRGIIAGAIPGNLAGAVSMIPDTFHLIPPSVEDEFHSMTAFRELRAIADDSRTAGYVVLIILLGLTGLIHYRQPRIMVRRLGTPLIFAGGLLSALFAAAFWFFATGGISRFLPATPAQNDNSALLAILMDLTNTLSARHSWSIVLAGLLMLLSGILLWIVARYGMHDESVD